MILCDLCAKDYKYQNPEIYFDDEFKDGYCVDADYWEKMGLY